MGPIAAGSQVLPLELSAMHGGAQTEASSPGAPRTVGLVVLAIPMALVPSACRQVAGLDEHVRVGDCVEVVDGHCLGAEAAPGRCACDSSRDELAIDEAPAGSIPPNTCVVLGEGTFGDLVLPVDAQVVGPVRGGAELSSLRLGAGAEACGVTVAGPIVVDEGADVRLRAVRGLDSPAAALTAGSRSSVDIIGSSFRRPALEGIDARGARRLSMVDSVVEGAGFAGITFTDEDGCSAEAEVDLLLDHVLFLDNYRSYGGRVDRPRPAPVTTSELFASVLVGGSRAALDWVEVRGTGTTPDFRGAAGVAIVNCSEATASDLTLEANAGGGVTVEASSAVLERGRLHANIRRGIRIRSIGAGQRVIVDGYDIGLTEGVGLSIDAKGDAAPTEHIVVRDTLIHQTQFATLPVVGDAFIDGDAAEVSVALQWLGQGWTELRNLRLVDNVGESVTVFRDVNGIMSGLRLEGSDAEAGIIHRCEQGASSLAREAGTPPVTKVDGGCFSVTP